MAERLMPALRAALADPSARTPDLGGTGTTTGFAEAIVRQISAG
jgi:isocitrate/isopropylmalate dehydrogenase